MIYCCDNYNILIKANRLKSLSTYLYRNNNILFFSFIIKNYDFFEFFNIYSNKYYKYRSLKQNDKAYAHRCSSSRRNKDSCS